ncbi:Flp pilus assembly protein CpaB [Thalassoglobus sp.]|uniref:Flp pilus assembly protein CpaB n=1 Tax=Thalassoglobus sp. TaxID=2795869 RepID=UPI003AA8C984
MNRVSPGTMTVVIFAILVGLGGAFLVRQQMNQPKLPPLSDIGLKTGPKKIIVPIASVDLEKGREISLHDIVIHQFTPEEFAKSKYAGQPFIGNTNYVIDRMLNQDMPKGSLFLPEHFYGEGFGPGVVDRLQPGFRAVTVPIQNIGAITGFADPGSIVDVLFRSNPEGERPSVTMTLLEQVEVLALEKSVLTGKRIEFSNDGSVTLAVTPAQAKMLKVVEGHGEISLTLRNPDDFGNFEFAPVNLDNQVQRNKLENLEQVMFNSAANLNSAASSASSSSSASSAKSSSAEFGSMNLVLEDASERVTMDDLLGLEANPDKKQLTLYRGGSREVVEFEEHAEDKSAVLRTGKRVQTPIAGRVPTRRNQENVSLDYLP